MTITLLITVVVLRSCLVLINVKILIIQLLKQKVRCLASMISVSTGTNRNSETTAAVCTKGLWSPSSAGNIKLMMMIMRMMPVMMIMVIVMVMLVVTNYKNLR